MSLRATRLVSVANGADAQGAARQNRAGAPEERAASEGRAAPGDYSVLRANAQGGACGARRLRGGVDYCGRGHGVAEVVAVVEGSQEPTFVGQHEAMERAVVGAGEAPHVCIDCVGA